MPWGMRIDTPNPTCLTSVHEIPEFLQGLSPRPELVCSLFPSVSFTHFLCSVRHLTHSFPRATLVSLLIPSCLSSVFLPVSSIVFSLYLAALSPVFDPYTISPPLCSLFSIQPSCFLLIFAPCSQSVPLTVRKHLQRFFSQFVEQYQRPLWQWRFVTGFKGDRFSSSVLFPV